MFVIATAGHVDHGKSTLIRALTGMEPDRWAEERRRGMTIDLGYAWTKLDGGAQVAFVDVPGHQRFVTNMLAGVGPAPAVLFVVAADEGWRAQSTEHLDALTALGVRHGVLAVSRSDLADATTAAAQAHEHLRGSTLVDVETVAVSATTGAGLDDLRAALGSLVASMPEPPPRPARLWVDRVFTIRGAGTVVTGTLGSGTLRAGDEVRIRPSGTRVRIRALQSLNRPVDEARAVSRVAVNLRGVKASGVRRGDALTAPEGWRDVSLLDVRVTADAEDLPVSLMLHLGSAAVPVRVRPLGSGFARLSLASALPVHVGEHVVLRDPGRRQVAAGALVLDTLPPALARRGAARRRAGELAAMRDGPDAAGEVSRRGAVRRSDLIAAGVAVPDVPAGTVAAGDWLVAQGLWQRWTDCLRAVVGTWSAAHPMLPAVPRRAAVEHIGLPDARLLAPLVAAVGGLALDAGGVRRSDVTPTLPSPLERRMQGLLQHFASHPFDAPVAAELEAMGLSGKALATAVGERRLVAIAPGVYLPPRSVDVAAERIRLLPQPFTASDARRVWGTTRRVAVPLLEYLDAQGITRRIDAQRRALNGGGGGRESNPPDRVSRPRRF